MLTLRCTLAVLFLISVSAGSTAFAETRLALVVGNSAYQSVPALPNPANDAKAVAGFLGGAGFDVTSAVDLTQTDMRKAIAEFAVKIAQAGSDSVALVYYAGHGVQIDGENFLIPVDARVQRESDVPLQAIRLTDVMNTLSSVPSRMRIVMLDACRNNPFSEINKTAGRGLAIVDAPAGSIVSYSTAPGTEAEDGAGENSPYTTALLAVAKEPGLPIEQAFKRTRLSVNQATAGRQTPWESSSLASDFSFFPPMASDTQQAKPPAAAQGGTAATAVKTVDTWRRELRSLPVERAYNIVISENSLEAYEAFVALYKEPPLVPRVRGLLDRRREMVAWYIAVLGNSADSFQAFLASYPSSDLTLTATRLLDRARSRTLVAPAPQVANLGAATPACSCKTPPARKKAAPRRASNPGPAPTYYPPPPRRGPPVHFDIGVGRGGHGGRPAYPPPPSRGGSPIYRR
jgi:hypothetical protein